MSSYLRFPRHLTAQSRSLIVTVVTSASLAIAGCSADVTRFDFPISGFSDDGDDQTSSLQSQQQNTYPYAASDSDQAPSQDYGGYDNSVSRSANQPISAPSLDSGRRNASSYDDELPKRTLQRPALTPYDQQNSLAPANDDFGRVPSSVTVNAGDTLYRISRRHGISVAALMAANGMSSPSIKPGQKLILPSSNGRQMAAVRPAPRQEPQPALRPILPSYPTADTRDTYTVRVGDSLYGISRRVGMKTSDLARLNGITDPGRLRVGQVLRLRGSSYVPTGTLTDQDLARPRSGQRVAKLDAVPGDTQRDADGTNRFGLGTRGVDEPQRVSRLPDPEPRSSSRFRWPVEGRIISGFGVRDDGTHNDGINLAAPKGTAVKAVENGVVAYAGSELQGYGKLLLVRHDGGWVSAYAHNDKLLLKRGDKVRRGQIIARSGMSGDVDRPQVHFELRKGSKPVDPIKHLARQ